MALSDLAVYSEYAYSGMTETLRQQIQLFNANSNGAIMLRQEANQGDFSDVAFFGKVDGLIRRRNPYNEGTVAEKTMRHIVDTMVKIGTGTPPVRIDKAWFDWIQRNPEEAGAALGQQIAVDSMADMLNTSLGATYAALSQESEIVYDATANAGADDKFLTVGNLINGAAKFGDQSSQIAAWIMHSGPMHKLWANAAQNGQTLFTYGTINIVRDPFGRVFIMTDSPALVTAGATPVYHSLGLTRGAVSIEQNSDFRANEDNTNGYENIRTTYQAEWSYNLGVKGFAWDKANGGKAPTDAALMTSTNWDRYATSHKDLAGVVIDSN